VEKVGTRRRPVEDAVEKEVISPETEQQKSNQKQADSPSSPVSTSQSAPSASQES